MGHADEQVNVYDDNGNFLHAMNRLQAEAENLRTENVVIFLYTSDSKLWLQQRALDKTYHPGLWDVSACGGMESHEHRDEAAARELFEETSLRPKLHYLTSALRDIPHNGVILHRYSHIYTGTTNEQPMPNEEVMDFKAWELKDLHEHMSKHPEQYIDNLVELINIADTKNPSSRGEGVW